MARQSLPAWRLITEQEAEFEDMGDRAHFWHCRPGMVADTNLLCVRVKMHPGQCHRFHLHPHMEEILYVISGQAEQWVGQEKRKLGAGDSLYLPAGMVHGTYNTSGEVLDFLAILTPAKGPEPAVVDVYEEEPWSSLR